ncbi:hypothetical protein [Paraclostridium sordellii]|uniref:hypothetical protein n=1 Tax=Paraclostridium sordellii TaxID=1505 RepID=UPI0005E919AF|nr:hypothetical protein [Paeniclostridium sordellii]CEN26587.1 Uncharacterised protein [[Clostridium] sordellii] [Paeniclostridium sordellii]CEP50431.1 Uncharacterised protein [[Clostridium] sordellii] [Paeniclostridium sordellii]
MNYMEMNNEILTQYRRLINNINESPDYVVNQIVQDYEPIGNSDTFKELQLSQRHMDNDMLSIFNRTIKISNDIDKAISECKEHCDVEGLRIIINEIVRHYHV